MTLEVKPSNALAFYGPLNEKLSASLILRNLSRTKKLAFELKTNVYPQKITVKPKRALIPPLGEISAKFHFIPSHPRGSDRIQIRWCEMASAFVTMETFDSVWSQAENFQQVESRYLDIVHLRRRTSIVGPSPWAAGDVNNAQQHFAAVRRDEVFEFGKSTRVVSFRPDILTAVEDNPFAGGWDRPQEEEGQRGWAWHQQQQSTAAPDEVNENDALVDLNGNVDVNANYLPPVEANYDDQWAPAVNAANAEGEQNNVLVNQPANEWGEEDAHGGGWGCDNDNNNNNDGGGQPDNNNQWGDEEQPVAAAGTDWNQGEDGAGGWGDNNHLADNWGNANDVGFNNFGENHSPPPTTNHAVIAAADGLGNQQQQQYLNDIQLGPPNGSNPLLDALFVVLAVLVLGIVIGRAGI